MARVLVLVALALFVAYLLTEGLTRLRGRLSELLSAGPANDTPAAHRGRAHRRRAAGELVACAACGVHVPRSRALQGSRSMLGDAGGGARLYCSEGCRAHRA